MIDYDFELRHHHLRLMRMMEIRTHDRVLDIGCGMGQTTRDIARLATEGCVIGIDIADSALQRARALTTGPATNAHYVCGSASYLPFPSQSFDVAISRFGTMFFDNPIAAFTNIRQTLRSSAQLTMMVWQSAERNEWAMEIERGLTGRRQVLRADAAGASAFSLSDKNITEHTLHSAGFVDVSFEDVREPVCYGTDIESAFNFISAFATVTSVVRSQTTSEREQTFARLREIIATHHTYNGVWFDSASWIVSARASS